jgi:hypothetical protein
MTLMGLVFWFALGYIFGLIVGPHVGRYRSKWGEVSIGGAIAGGIGASAPYVILHSIWVQRVVEGPSFSEAAELVIWSVKHVAVTCVASCVVVLVVTELFSRRAGPNESLESPSPQSDGDRRKSRRRAEAWLLLCLPGAAYSLWERFNGETIGAGWPTYVAGSMIVVGIIGYLISVSATTLRSSR